MSTVTVKGSGGNYTTLNAAFSGQSGALSEVLNIECYASAAPDTTPADTGTGFTGISATVYINVTVPAAERHAGVWSESKYRLEVSFTGAATERALALQEAYCRVDGLQIKVTNNGTAKWGIIFYSSTVVTSKHYCTNNIIRFVLSGTADNCRGILDQWNGGTGGHYNNLIYDIINGAYTNLYGARCSTTGTNSEFYNDTFVNCYTGLTHTGTSIKVKNNLFSSCTIATAGLTGGADVDYNATDLSGLGYTQQTHDRISQTFSFIDEGNDNFHLKFSDLGALGYGVNLYNDANFPFQSDMDGGSRGGAGEQWDIGADEYFVIEGSACWGHVTGVTEDNVQTFAVHWAGTASIVNTGDSEVIIFTATGQYMVSEPVNTGVAQITLIQNEYVSGRPVTMKYRTAATKEGLTGSWTAYTAPFQSSGYADIRLES